MRRAFDHLRDLLSRRRRRGLKNKRLEQRRLAHQHELCDAASLQSSISRSPGLNPRIEIVGEPADGLRDHVLIKAAADLGHPFGDRHHGADRRSAARPAQQFDIGVAEFPQRGRRHRAAGRN